MTVSESRITCHFAPENLKKDTYTNHPQDYQMIDPSITTRIDPFLLPTQTYNPSTSHAHTQSILIPQPIYDTLPYDFNISLSDSINFNLINPTPLTPTNYAAQQHFQSMSQQLHQSQQQHQMQQQLHSNSVSPQMLQQTTMSRQPSMQSSETSTRVFDQQWEWTQTAPTSSAASITSYPNAGAEMQGGGQGQMQNAQMRQMIDWREWSHEYELPFDDPGAGR